MISRRSRLKAVTNLPVRRKTLTSQGNGSETVNTSTSETLSLPAVTGEDISSNNDKHTSFLEEKEITDNSIKSKGNESIISENCDVDFKIIENCSEEVAVSKVIDTNKYEVTENTNELNNPSNSSGLKSEGTSGPLFRSSKRFKPNLVLSVREREQSQLSDKRKEKQSSKELNCINNSNNNYNSGNNNIVKEGFKCYTVLTSQNVALSPLSEYTITPLTPCSVDANVDEVDPPQEYEEAPIYTAIESAELFINGEVNENCQSIIDTQSFEPVLTNLTNCNNENDVKSKNYCLSKNYAELKNVSENLDKKPVVKNRALNIRNNCNGNNEHYGNSVGQLRDSHILENTISSISLNVTTDLSSLKQTTSTVRRRRTKYSDFTKKLADAKREFQKKYEKTKPDRSTLKMIDLIFYNPATNPMESKGKLEKKDTLTSASGVIQDLLAEEKVDEPESVECNSKFNLSDSCDTESTNKMPVPQVKIGVDGEIILDERSLVIETTDAKKGREGLQNSVPIFEDREYKVSYYRGKSKKTRDWTDFETKRFYKALNTIGPDFTLMQKYFPKRSRLELKNKFKREERLNRSLIDKALNNPSEFDMTQLEKDLAVEKEAEEVELEMRLCRIMKRAARKPRVKTSYLSREIIETDDESDDDQPESFNMTTQALTENEKNKKEKEFNFVFKQLLAKESKKSLNILPEISSSSSNAFQYSENGLT